MHLIPLMDTQNALQKNWQNIDDLKTDFKSFTFRLESVSKIIASGFSIH